MAEEGISTMKPILLYLLILSMLGCVTGARSIDDTGSTNHHQHQHDHMAASNNNPNVMVFFTLADLKQGAKMPIYFPIKNPSTSPRFLPREEADSIPFSSQQLPYLLKFFSYLPGSHQATAMEQTLTHCQGDPIKGEVKFCATSLESMLDFVRETLQGEGEGGIRVVSTTHLNRSSGVVLQNYTVLGEPREVEAPKLVSCHTMPYPYAIFYCHSQATENKVFLVDLEGVEKKGDRVEAVAVCHMDTSQWGRGHVSFQVLGVEPGFSGVCHFFPEDNLVYVPVPTHAAA
ncbi:unnamed protein product [Linum tenue]|uniref:BURP domain-containing protein n=1 Tax=Linum tenue TaxID=586396 RepID=A0AAV0GYB0_9ROSI|nr:unnamed protein product [Linum tenue]CAI0377660.1 unnamed protein product [Linum tenue]